MSLITIRCNHITIPIDIDKDIIPSDFDANNVWNGSNAWAYDIALRLSKYWIDENAMRLYEPIVHRDVEMMDVVASEILYAVADKLNGVE